MTSPKHSMHWIQAIAFGLVFAFHSSVFSTDSSHQQKVEDMLDMMNLEEQLNASSQEIKNLYSNQIEKISLPDDYKEIIGSYQEKVFQLISSSISWSNQKSVYVAAFANSLSEESVDQIISFLSSPAGIQFIKSQQEVEGLVKQQLQTQMFSMQQQLTLLTNEFQAEIRRFQETQVEKAIDSSSEGDTQ